MARGDDKMRGTSQIKSSFKAGGKGQATRAKKAKKDPNAPKTAVTQPRHKTHRKAKSVRE
jgi:hypothetical protein